MRKLATIRRIDEIRPIPEADAIECAVVGGWTVVVRKGEFKVGDLAIYIEIDSWVPHTIAPFLSKGHEPREYEGVIGERLKTAKLRGQISQGLLLPVEQEYIHDEDDVDYEELAFIISKPGKLNEATGIVESSTFIRVSEGQDVSEFLGIIKWDAPIPAQLAGQVKGNFPGFIRKTDQERCLGGDTEVETPTGCKKIKDITIDDEVLSLNHETNEVEFKRVIDTHNMSRKNSGWFKVTLKSGKTIMATHNHKIWIENLSCYRNVEDLKNGDKVKIYQKD